MGYDYRLIRVRHERGVVFARFDNPPVNVITLPLYQELMAFTREVADDGAARVVVFESADPDFFLAHFDVEVLVNMDVSGDALRSTELNPYHHMCERVRTMPKATIAKIAGRAGGGGSEFAASCDMRFGALGRTKINQMEVAIGILPGGTGTQRLCRLLGRSRALEVILGSDDLDAETAERWGYLNRALPAGQLDGFVDALAYRIASFPPEAVALAKQAVVGGEVGVHDGLIEEAYLFQQLMRSEAAHDRMRRFLRLGGQTRAGELRVGELCREVAESAALDGLA